jgi:hypothetical protein
MKKVLCGGSTAVTILPNQMDEKAKRKDTKGQGREDRHWATCVRAALGPGATVGEPK